MSQIGDDPTQIGCIGHDLDAQRDSDMGNIILFDALCMHIAILMLDWVSHTDKTL